VALVQGGSSGMGRAVACTLGVAGATVIVGARSREDCQATADHIQAGGGVARALPVDVIDAVSLATLFELLEQHFGRLDLAVNDVGATFGQSNTQETPPERFARTLAVNLMGTFRCLQHEITLMMQGAGGAIVNISSIGGTRGFAGIQDYCAAKWGLIATERFEQAREQYRATIDARLAGIPQGHAGTGNDIASPVPSLLGPQSAFITGAVIAVDGGESARTH